MIQQSCLRLIFGIGLTVRLLFFPLIAQSESWNIQAIEGPAGTTRVIPRAINNNREVVGTAKFAGRNEDTAFFWKNGTMVELELPAGAFSSKAFDVSDNGVIVGYTSYRQAASDDGTFATYWLRDSASQTYKATRLDYNFEGADTQLSYFDYGSKFFGVNEKFSMAGSAGAKHQFGMTTVLGLKPLISTGGAAYTALFSRDLANLEQGHAFKINSFDTVLSSTNVGPADRSVLLSGGSRTLLNLLGGYQGLNDRNEAVGESMFVSGQVQHATWFNGTTHIDLGTAQPASRSIANSINNNDWIVGRIGTGSNSAPDSLNAFGYLWRPNAPATGLTFLGGTGWVVYSATDINDENQIIGVGDPGSGLRGFVMNPVGIGFTLTGVARDASGNPLPGVQVRVLRLNGTAAGTPVTTDSDGAYTWNLTPGTYFISALPEDAFAIAENDDCTITGTTCRIDLDKNKVVSFAAIAGPTSGMPSPTPTILVTPNEIIRNKLGELSVLLKKVKLTIPKKQAAAQKQLSADIKKLTAEIVTYTKSNAAQVETTSVKIKLTKLATAVKNAAGYVIRRNSRTFATDKKAASTSISNFRKGLK